MNISVVGLGKLGLCTAACLASKGHRVIGFDIDCETISKLNNNAVPISEAGLSDLLNLCRHSLTFTTDVNHMLRESDITFIIVPTPSDEGGGFSNIYVLDVLENIKEDLKGKNTFHVINIVSTVMPGSSEQIFKPFLETSLNKVCGEDFGLVYNPEFIALGSVIRDFLNPDLVLIGSSDKQSGAIVRKIYESTCENNPHYAEMSLINAEITKLSINCYVTLKISFANELASICEKIPGADVDEITDAVGMDSRVGGRGIKSGLGFGGPCFPRDNVAFGTFARRVGVKARLCEAVRKINLAVEKRIFDAVITKISPHRQIAVLGLSYKPGTHIIEKSQSISLIRSLLEVGYDISVHDPMAVEETRAVLRDLIQYHDDPYAAAEAAKALILMTDWPVYRRLDWDRIIHGMDEGAFVFDSWLILKGRNLGKTSYWGPGYGEK